MDLHSQVVPFTKMKKTGFVLGNNVEIAHQ
jgi:hypothetical protein